MTEPREQQLPPSLSAKFQGSFAYFTIRDRLPVILARIADTVYRKKVVILDQYGEDGSEDLKSVAGCVSKLRNEVQTNKEIIPLTDSHRDVEVWNKYLKDVTEKENQAPKWFLSPWLYVECYMYRRIQEAVFNCKVLKDLDVFEEQKQKTFMDSQRAIITLMTYLQEVSQRFTTNDSPNVQMLLQEFMQVALWGNKCDLSISASQENAQEQCLLEQLHHLEPNILVNDFDQVWSLLKEKGQFKRIDIVLDNAGFELISDLCLAEYLIISGITTDVYLHGKAFPWFVSDVTPQDFKWTLNMLCASNSISMSHFGNVWKNRLEDGSWKFSTHDFWTMPFDFSEMKTYASDLYQELKTSGLVFLKGDLNYRKLVGDRNWNTTTSFVESLHGFYPSPLCSLRTSKADVIVGLKDRQAGEIEKMDKDYMINGNWAVISYSSKLDV